MAFRDVLNSAVKQVKQNKQDKQGAKLFEHFGNRPVQKVLLLEKQDKVYTDTFYIYDDPDSIKYTVSDYSVRSTLHTMRLYDKEANVIGSVEEIRRRDSNSDSNSEGNSYLKLFIKGNLVADMQDVFQPHKAITYSLSNGWSVEGNVTATEFTIFHGGNAVVQLSCKQRYKFFSVLTDVISFYDNVDELLILLIVLAIEIIHLPDKDFSGNNRYKEAIENYKLDIEEIKERQELRAKLFSHEDNM